MNYDFSTRNSPILPDLRIQLSTLTQNSKLKVLLSPTVHNIMFNEGHNPAQGTNVLENKCPPLEWLLYFLINN